MNQLITFGGPAVCSHWLYKARFLTGVSSPCVSFANLSDMCDRLHQASTRHVTSSGLFLSVFSQFAIGSRLPEGNQRSLVGALHHEFYFSRIKWEIHI